MNVSKCPGCQQSDISKLDGQRAVCRSCSKGKKRVFQFCWACQREWPRSTPNTNSCNLPNCALRAALLSGTKITDPNSSVKGCPYFRACPGCKALLTHNGRGCPNIVCPHCHTRFCFQCMRRQCFGIYNFDVDELGLYNRLLFPLRRARSTFLESDLAPCRVVDNRQSLTILGL